jgi:hypothetical protein
MKKITLLVGAMALLLLSWMTLFGVVEFGTEFYLPYDTGWYDCTGGICADHAWPADSPSPESWQGRLNYFLEIPPGNTLPAVFSVGISVLLLGIALARVPSTLEASLPLLSRFALSNLLASAILFFNDFLLPSPSGWRWPLILDLVMLGVLFVLQARFIPSHLHAATSPQTAS